LLPDISELPNISEYIVELLPTICLYIFELLLTMCLYIFELLPTICLPNYATQRLLLWICWFISTFLLPLLPLQLP